MTVKLKHTHFNICIVHHSYSNSIISDHIIFHNQPIASEADTMTVIAINPIATQLYSTLSVHSHSSPAITEDTVSN